MTAAAESHQVHEVTVLVDRKPVQSPRRTTAGALLRAAAYDPTHRELVRVDGRHQMPYPDPDTAIELHEDETFITVSKGPTPVS